MALTPGTRLGPYEIVAPIGAGGMGEVYRARDTRLGRDVAVKVLPDAFANDADRRARFEHEAQAVAALSHPNIVSLFDTGVHGDHPFVVMELLVGETLRDRLASSSLSARGAPPPLAAAPRLADSRVAAAAGALPIRKALDIAVQIARGLAAAHDKGLVHRDLKPENIFLLADGHVKILDFGLARTFGQDANRATADTRTAAATDPGTVMGTVGYMAPEQVRGDAADQRSDIFTFALVLYEMISGRRAFAGASSVETMSAILKEEPPPLSGATRVLPPGLERLIDRCLQKSPDQRYQSAKDLAYQLEGMALDSTTGVSPPDVTPRATGSRRLALVAVVLLAAMLGGAGLFFWGRSTGSAGALAFTRLTFRRGTIGSARFAPDGQTIVYSAAWQGDRSELFSARTNSADARSLGLPGVSVFSISSTGEMALRLPNGTLARAPLAGGSPREVLESVSSAAWGPDGTTLAAVHFVAGRRKLEFPIGKVLYDTAGVLSSVSVSRNGDLIACAEAAPGLGSRASLIVVDLAGNKRVVSENWRVIRGLGWSPDGRELWFAGLKADVGGTSLFAVTLTGMERQLMHIPVNLALDDISRDGRLLLERSTDRLEAVGVLPGDTKERNLSMFDFNGLSDLSPDGRTLILTEAGDAGLHVYLQRADGSQPVRLGDGGGFALSPDGRSVILARVDPPKLLLLPTGPGETRPLEHQPFAGYLWGNWFPDGRRILFAGSEPGHGIRLYVQDLAGGPPRAIAPEGVAIPTGADAISPDGLWVAAVAPPGRRAVLYPIDGGDPRPLAGVSSGDLPTRWSADGRVLYLYRQNTIPAPVYRLDVSSGKKDLWKEVGPNDLAGVTGIGHFQVTPDGAAYTYNYQRTLSDLYVVHGVK